MHEFFYSRAVLDAPDPAAQPGGTLFTLALWIRLGFIGGSVLVAALVSMIDVTTRTGLSFAAAAVGGLLASMAWLRVRKALHQQDRAAGVVRRASVRSSF